MTNLQTCNIQVQVKLKTSGVLGEHIECDQILSLEGTITDFSHLLVGEPLVGFIYLPRLTLDDKPGILTMTEY